MPRPKRSKVAPSAPTARIPTKSNSSINRKPSPRPAAIEDGIDSTDSDSIITRIRPRRNRSASPENGDFYMSGALPDVPDGVLLPRPKPLNKKLRAELSRITRDADAKEKKRASQGKKAEAHVSSAREPPQEMAAQPDSSALFAGEDHVEVPRSPVLPAQGKVIETVEQTDQYPGSAWKAPATPGIESSILARGNFKRRSRQPSIVRIGREEDESITLGSFGDLDNLGSDLSDDLKDFHPEDESTPLHVVRHTSRSNVAHVPSQAITSVPRASSSSSPSRKRKITPPEVQVPRSQSAQSEAVTTPERSTEESGLPGFHEENEDFELPPPKKRARSPPNVFSDTMALPRSSSPPQSQDPPASVDRARTTKGVAKTKSHPKRKQQPRGTAPLSPKTRSRKTGPKPVPTSLLQSLLPRRRTNHHDNDFDIPSSNEAQDNVTSAPTEEDDELSFAAPTVRKARNIPSTTSKSKQPTVKPPSKTPSSRVTKSTKTSNTTLRSSVLERNKSKSDRTREKPPARTYTRRRSSDKENESSSLESNPSDSLFPSGVEEDSRIVGVSNSATTKTPAQKPKGELKTFAKKFKEVDNWSLDFEDFTGDSSPKDAR